MMKNMMKMMKKITGLLAMLTIAVGCSKDDANNVLPTPTTEVVTVNVDVVLPANVQEQWKTTINMAQDNIAMAQKKLNRQIKLNLRYHDEDTEDLDALAYRLTHPEEGDDTCQAIIGPYHSSNAMTFLKYAWQNRLPVVMPSCTSAELQRINARATYAWFLTESDITQCEIMVAAASMTGYQEIALIYNDDDYGKSFFDWIPYYAAEQGMKLAGTIRYTKGQNLTDELTAFAKASKNTQILACVALSDANDYLDICKQVNSFLDTNSKGDYVTMSTLCADTSLDNKVFNAGERSQDFQMGITPYCSPSYGFPQALYGIETHNPIVGEAQMYDALTIIALGAAHQAANGEKCIINGEQVAFNEKPYGPVLNDHMRAVVSQREATPTSWPNSSLSIAFTYLSMGLDVDISGASGSLLFDLDTSTKILNTTYLLWYLDYFDYSNEGGGITTKVQPLLYLSTSGSNTEASASSIWEHKKTYSQTFEDVDRPEYLPDIKDHWAVVISPSTTWSNYRHQADAFAMYQTLRNHGYDDDHIVLIVEDNLANDSHNTFPGQIFVERSTNPRETDPLINEDVRKGALVDYHFTELQPADLADIMLGLQSERLPQVIKSTENSDVFFFWSGHGGYGEGPLWGNEDGRGFGTARIKDIVTQMSSQQKFRRMMFSIETCFSGCWGEALTGIPNVLVLTAATAYETSKADVHDRELGVFLSNAFARTFRRQVNANKDIKIYDLYRELFRTTTGSHVSIYNQQYYGSVYTESMGDYLPQ